MKYFRRLFGWIFSYQIANLIPIDWRNQITRFGKQLFHRSRNPAIIVSGREVAKCQVNVKSIARIANLKKGSIERNVWLVSVVKRGEYDNSVGERKEGNKRTQMPRIAQKAKNCPECQGSPRMLRITQNCPN